MAKIPKDIFLPLNMGREKKNNQRDLTVMPNKSISLVDWLIANQEKIGIKSIVTSYVSISSIVPKDNSNFITITALAEDLTVANPTSIWTEGQELIIRIKDDGTPRTVAFDTKYRAVGVTLPTTTVASKTLYLGIIYNAVDDKFDIVGYNLEV